MYSRNMQGREPQEENGGVPLSIPPRYHGVRFGTNGYTQSQTEAARPVIGRTRAYPVHGDGGGERMVIHRSEGEKSQEPTSPRRVYHSIGGVHYSPHAAEYTAIDHGESAMTQELLPPEGEDESIDDRHAETVWGAEEIAEGQEESPLLGTDDAAEREVQAADEITQKPESPPRKNPFAALLDKDISYDDLLLGALILVLGMEDGNEDVLLLLALLFALR